MEKLTQGSIITSIRNKKYNGIECMGIVISARCDLVSGREKVDKVYYLTALEINDWLLSNIGWKTLTKNKVQSLSCDLNKKLEKYSLDWNTMKYFSSAEFQLVIADPDNNISKSNQLSLQKDYDQYLLFQQATIQEKKEFYRKNEKILKEGLTQIFNGTNTHFTFISSKSFDKYSDASPGLIADHEELFFFPLKIAKAVEKMEVDEKVLTEETKEEYDKFFFIKSGLGFSVISNKIASPWIEYLTQRFSTMFSRIGVDNPEGEDVKKIVENLVNKWKEKQ